MKKEEKPQLNTEAISTGGAVSAARKSAVKRWSAGKWLLFIVLLLVVFAAVPVVNELIPQKVKVKFVSFDGVKEVEYSTRAHKVSDFTSEHGSEITTQDKVNGFTEQDMDTIQPSDVAGSLKNVISDGRRVIMSKISDITGGSTDVEKEDTGRSSSADNEDGGSAEDEDGSSAYNEDGDGTSVLYGIPESDDSGDAYVRNGMEITVLKAGEATAKIAGEKKNINIYPGTVRETLELNDIAYDEDDLVKPALDDKMTADTKIKLTAVEIKYEDKTLPVEPKEKGAIFDKSLASGTITRTKGEPGKAVYTYKYKYINGKKIKTSRKFKKWIKTPVDIRLTFGTSQTGETGSVDYSETFIGNCTAYYFGNNAHGATGGHCHYGTCAVDPSVIPYGTKLYVEGYGTAVANDCGGAVKGHIIDLYMRSTKECFQWGRRNKKVYVLK